ncbi:hypothetical protein C7477_11118 [Phyllobacterium leguminum]|uniref:Uncharacterized protein n=1 Tax=Phyllobacterium leguminum TaxID=314237 RepID=A0A318TGA8_9HYPH|nr:hypothetical protein C7477_11118 [Phyllobacterium leguminum]
MARNHYLPRYAIGSAVDEGIISPLEGEMPGRAEGGESKRFH